MESSEYFEGGKVYVWDETFAIAQTEKTLINAFAVIQDKKEITVIMDQEKIHEDDVIQMDNNWKLITFDMVLPLQTIGFLAKVTTVLADEHISVCALSTYSTDHILVKEHDLLKTLRKLETLGLSIKKA
ncbi:MAG: ACT domain-containing protein [Candidatus Bathyarchaeota archaeon]|nr:ACT domain-containing protein [Candidatus Bathyarchaeota archaeon]